LKVALVAVVGDDAFGRFMREALAERGVETSAITVDPERPTGVSVVLVRGADRAILTAAGTIAHLTAVLVDEQMVKDTRHLHVSSYFLQRRLRPDLQEVLAGARAAGATTSIDPNWDPDEEWNGGLRSALPHVDILFVNAEEATRIAGSADVEVAAGQLAELGPLVVVKIGAAGALAVSPGQAVIWAAAPSVEVVDTVGAGDSFDAGFLSGVLAGLGVEESLELACACGSLSTTAAGGTSAQPTLGEATAL
jgi:sugar/nucleoside kinase (ribokinase family)